MYVQKTFHAKTNEVEKKWLLIDAKDQVVGRLASEIAQILMGKNKPTYTPHIDTGDHVVVVNAEKIRFTGKKLEQKLYRSHSGYVGGLKERSAAEQLEKFPERILMSAVKGMLPKTSMGRKQLTKLRIFAGEKHTHDAQKPEAVEVKY